MNKFKIKDLIPNTYPEILSFYKWWNTLTYTRASLILHPELNKTDDTINFYKDNYDITLTEEDIYNKPYIIAYYTYYPTHLKERKDVLTLINYDSNLIRRIAAINGTNASDVFRCVFSNERIFDNDIRYSMQEEDMIIIMNEGIMISKYINSLVFRGASNLCDIPDHITSLTLRFSNLSEHYVIPTTIVKFDTDSIINDNKYTLHDGITHLSCEELESKLPINLKHLALNELNDNIDIPETLETLRLSKQTSLHMRDKLNNIKYLSLDKTNIITSDKIRDKVRYLRVFDFNDEMYNLFPNLKILYSETITASKLPSKLKILKTNIIFTPILPDGLIYLIITQISSDIKLPNSVQVLQIDNIASKYNVNTLICPRIEERYLSDQTKLLFTDVYRDLSYVKNDVVIIKSRHWNF